MIYARYSSDNQTEQSIEGQMRVCNDYAKNNNIVILDSYIDRAMTGTNDNRPAFQQMLKDSNKKLWDYVLVYKLDRFSRNKYETTIHKKTLKDNADKITEDDKSKLEEAVSKAKTELESTHHIDFNKHNNQASNLVFMNHNDHLILHKLNRK